MTNRAVFLDRDGVILEDTGYPTRIETVVFVDGIGEALSLLSQAGYRLIVITNQSAIARGMISLEGFFELSDAINRKLAQQRAPLDAVYFCPHHPSEGASPWRTVCNCRKPAPGLILRAISEWGLEAGNCWMVGDSPRDLDAAQSAGVRPLAFRFDHPSAPRFNSLLELARHIIESDAR